MQRPHRTPSFCEPEALTQFLGGQLLMLGTVSVGLNTAADLIVVMLAIPTGRFLRASPRFRRNQRVASGVGMVGLGAFVAFGEGK